MFSFQTLHVLCELRKCLPKYRIMWPMPLYLFWNLAILYYAAVFFSVILVHRLLPTVTRGVRDR